MKSWSNPNWDEMQIESNYLESQNLNLFDSSTNQIKPLEKSNEVGIYVCGITPYDSAHLGHAFTYLTFDSILRILKFLGKKVNYVQNLTDIDDPLFERARKTNSNWQEIVETQTEIYREDMKALNIFAPNHFLSVNENVKLIVDNIESLIEKNSTYKLQENLYFKLNESNKSQLIEKMSSEDLIVLASERGCDIQTVGKLNAIDPILWRKSENDEPEWVTNFGTGRPGWHIQCVSLAKKYLNFPINIQGGGQDLIFPHHAMCDEISKSLNIENYASNYLHVGMVGYQGSKMSKSKGNLVFVHDLLEKGINSNVLRFMLLNHHWHNDWEYFESDIEKYEYLYQKIENRLKDKYISFEDFQILFSYLLNNLDFPKSFEFLKDIRTHEYNERLVSLNSLMNNLYGLKIS